MHLGSWMHDSFENKFTDKNGQKRTPVPAADLKPGSRLLTYPELTENLYPT